MSKDFTDLISFGIIPNCLESDTQPNNSKCLTDEWSLFLLTDTI